MKTAIRFLGVTLIIPILIISIIVYIFTGRQDFTENAVKFYEKLLR